MMTWNHRIVLHDEDHNEDHHWYGLHECFYNKDRRFKSGWKTGWTANPVTFVCDVDEGPWGIIKSLERAIEALKKSAILSERDKSTWKPQ